QSLRVSRPNLRDFQQIAEGPQSFYFYSCKCGRNMAHPIPKQNLKNSVIQFTCSKTQRVATILYKQKHLLCKTAPAPLCWMIFTGNSDLQV
uniref:Uncharacterized protein n=1 Tax=Fundulus heteroclitus TaxID=8078 RepID=A0A3Q2NYB5_FUNHE